MTTAYHTAIVAGAAANVASVNTPLGTLDAQLVAVTALATNVNGGAAVTDARLIEWAEAEAYNILTPVYDATYPELLSNDAPSAVIWPDGGTGAFTVTEYNATWVCVIGYTITHIVAPTTRTVTQTTIVRDATTGNVTSKPRLTVA